MTTIEEQRLEEVAKYEKAHKQKKYNMKQWRQDILKDWFEWREPGWRYLDVGCGKAESLVIAREAGLQARGCDVVDYLCEVEDIDLIEGAHSLPYVDNQFRLSTCNDVLEHIIEEDVPAVLAELSRVTSSCILLGISRKPGKLHITIKSEEWWLEKIRENMAGEATVVYADRVKPLKQPYLWVEIKCA